MHSARHSISIMLGRMYTSTISCVGRVPIYLEYLSMHRMSELCLKNEMRTSHTCRFRVFFCVSYFCFTHDNRERRKTSETNVAHFYVIYTELCRCRVPLSLQYPDVRSVWRSGGLARVSRFGRASLISAQLEVMPIFGMSHYWSSVGVMPRERMGAFMCVCDECALVFVCVHVCMLLGRQSVSSEQ